MSDKKRAPRIAPTLDAVPPPAQQTPPPAEAEADAASIRVPQARDPATSDTMRADPIVPARPGPRKRRSWLARTAWGLGLGLVGFVVGSALLVGSFALVDPSSTAFMRRAQAKLQAQRGEPVTLRHQWVDLAQISGSARRAVIAAEDQKFDTHFGFDVDAMRDAYAANQHGKRVRGASTISQQTMKNLFLSPSRSYLRKGIEAWLTLWAELLLGKERIMEIYLNSAQFGDDIFGVEAAAQAYFNVPASDLTASQAAWLAVLLPAPSRYQIQPPTRFTQQRHDWILDQMQQLYGR